jgi:hypothetical protein
MNASVGPTAADRRTARWTIHRCNPRDASLLRKEGKPISAESCLLDMFSDYSQDFDVILGRGS